MVGRHRRDRLAVCGLGFKPGTDEIRGAPGLSVEEAFLADGATLRLYDPRTMAEFARHVPARRTV